MSLIRIWTKYAEKFVDVHPDGMRCFWDSATGGYCRVIYEDGVVAEWGGRRWYWHFSAPRRHSEKMSMGGDAPIYPIARTQGVRP